MENALSRAPEQGREVSWVLASRREERPGLRWRHGGPAVRPGMGGLPLIPDCFLLWLTIPFSSSLTFQGDCFSLCTVCFEASGGCLPSASIHPHDGYVTVVSPIFAHQACRTLCFGSCCLPSGPLLLPSAQSSVWGHPPEPGLPAWSVPGPPPAVQPLVNLWSVGMARAAFLLAASHCPQTILCTG